MKLKQLCSLFLAGFCCFLADDCTAQDDNDKNLSNDQYNEADKDNPSGTNQPTIKRDEDSGNTYVIPWNESNEYYGAPPPPVLDSEPQNPFPDSNSNSNYNQLNELPN